MNQMNVLLILPILFAAIAGCNRETPEQQHDREMTKILQQGAHDPVDWSARNAPPIGKMDRRTGLPANEKMKDR